MPEAVHIPWQPIGGGRASEAIYDQLRELITSGVLKPGNRLPSERAMMEQLHALTGMDIPETIRLDGATLTNPKDAKLKVVYSYANATQKAEIASLFQHFPHFGVNSAGSDVA